MREALGATLIAAPVSLRKPDCSITYSSGHESLQDIVQVIKESIIHTFTLWPARLRAIAAPKPAGPPPTTTTCRGISNRSKDKAGVQQWSSDSVNGLLCIELCEKKTSLVCLRPGPRTGPSLAKSLDPYLGLDGADAGVTKNIAAVT